MHSARPNRQSQPSRFRGLSLGYTCEQVWQAQRSTVCIACQCLSGSEIRFHLAIYDGMVSSLEGRYRLVCGSTYQSPPLCGCKPVFPVFSRPEVSEVREAGLLQLYLYKPHVFYPSSPISPTNSSLTRLFSQRQAFQT